jgi:uncharacterized protein (TIGR02145 family)
MKKLLLCAAFIVVSFTSIAQVGIGTTTPHPSAALEIESTTKGFLLPRMTLVQINAIATPLEGLMVYCLDCTTKGVFVNNGSDFIYTISGENMNALAIAAIVAVATNPAAGGTPSLADLAAVSLINLTAGQTAYEEAIAVAIPTPTTLVELQAIIDAVNNIGKDTTTTVVELMSSTGKTWMDRNLGATQAAASSTDAASYGDLYQWGRAKDGHESRTSSTTTTTATSAAAGHGNFIIAGDGTNYNWTTFGDRDALWQSGLNDPCPTGYRIPTETELETERVKFSSNNAAGAFSALKLPFASIRYSSGTLNTAGEESFYWSSTHSMPNNPYARGLYLSNSAAVMNDDFRASGVSVRCIKKE